MATSEHSLRRAARLLFVLGLALGAQAAYIPAKAVLAQALLERAWRRAERGEVRVRPWPWADTWPVARLEAPTRGVKLIVLAGATGSSLAFGPGHLSGSARPGTAGNVVLAGHRDTHFRFLQDLGPGEPLVLTSPDGSRRIFRVQDTAVRDRAETDLIRPTREPTLTLVTCWPFDALVPGGPLRYLVRAALASKPG